MRKWKDINGYKGLYKISNDGLVESVGYGKKKILKTHLMTSGYEQLNLYKNKDYKKHSIHRLVAEHFVVNPMNKKEVNHKDGNKLNNHYTNLEWMTHAENFNHAYGNIFDNKGENHGNSKLKDREVATIKKRLINGDSYKEIAMDYNVSRSTINYISIGRTWNHVNPKK